MQPINDKMTSLRQQMLRNTQEALQKEVQFGNVTQEQADQIINRMNERMKQAGSGGNWLIAMAAVRVWMVVITDIIAAAVVAFKNCNGC